MGLNPADFKRLYFRKEPCLQCVYCGEILREGPVGKVRYNFDCLNYCVYCISYAKYGIPASVDRFQGIIHLFPNQEIK